MNKEDFIIILAISCLLLSMFIPNVNGCKCPNYLEPENAQTYPNTIFEYVPTNENGNGI